MLEYKGVEVHWLKHAGFLIRSKDCTIVIDPFGLGDKKERADLLLISHTHADHFEEASIKNVIHDKTVAFCSEDAEEKLKQWVRSTTALRPHEMQGFKEVSIQATPAYNLEKKFHPKENNWLGFLIEIEGVTIYFAGDTDPLKDLENIKCDIGLFPVSGIYVMDAGEAAEFANKIRPKVASIPMHWGSLIDDEGRKVGVLEDAKAFCSKVAGAQILKQECQ